MSDDTLSILWSRDPLEFGKMTPMERKEHLNRIVAYYKSKYQVHKLTGKPAPETTKIDLVSLGLLPRKP